MNLCSFRPLVDDRRVDVHVRVMPLDQRDPFGRGDDADHADVGGAGFAEQVERGDGAAAGRQHRVDHQHVAAAQIRRQLRVVPATRPRSVRRAAGRCARRARRAAARARRPASPGPRAAPGRRRRPVRTRRPSAGPSGVCTDTGLRRHVARRFGREQQADADGHPPENLGWRGDVAQRRQRVVHDRMLDDMQWHGKHYMSAGPAGDCVTPNLNSQLPNERSDGPGSKTLDQA